MRFRVTPLLLGLSLMTVPASAREGKNPPSLALHEKFRQIIVARAVEPVGDEAFRFTTLKNLFRQAPEELTLRMAPETASRVQPGSKYIVAFTEHRKVRFPGMSGLDPDGPRVVRIPQTGEAVFEYSRALRRMITWQQAGKQLATRKLFSLATRLLQSSDPAVQRFGASEIAQRRLMEVVGGNRLDEVEAFVRDRGRDGSARHVLFVASGRLPAESRTWRGELARQLVGETPTTLDPTGLEAGFVLLALEILTEEGTTADAQTVQRWLVGNHGPVAEKAAIALETLAPETAAQKIREALEQEDLSTDVRFVLNLRLKRLS